jgi:ankyrin repeat protein
MEEIMKSNRKLISVLILMGLILLAVAACSSPPEDLKDYVVDEDDLDAYNDQGFTALMKAAADGNVEVVEYLLDNDVELDNGDKQQHFTALCFATINNNYKCAELLLEAGANPDIQDRNDGNTPIFYAAGNQNKEFVDLLIKAGADLNIESSNGVSPIFYATLAGNLDIVKALVENGADPNYVSKGGNTVLDIAVNSDNSLIPQYLIEVMDKDLVRKVALKYGIGEESSFSSQPETYSPPSTSYEKTFNHKRYTVIFCSETNKSSAQRKLEEVSQKLPQYLFFLDHSNNHAGMTNGYWVVFSQGYDNRAGAEQVIQDAKYEGLDCYFKDLGN